MHPYVHGSFIGNSQDMEASTVSIDRKMDKEKFIYIVSLSLSLSYRYIYIYIYLYIYIFLYIYMKTTHTHTLEYDSAIKKNEILRQHEWT